jgi:hypothetical protein
MKVILILIAIISVIFVSIVGSKVLKLRSNFMVCSDCIYKNKCYYGPLEEWEERFLYPPCVYLSEYHVDYIRDKSFEAIDYFEF